jgi:hypothetical protein
MAISLFSVIAEFTTLPQFPGNVEAATDMIDSFRLGEFVFTLIMCFHA